MKFGYTCSLFAQATAWQLIKQLAGTWFSGEYFMYKMKFGYTCSLFAQATAWQLIKQTKRLTSLAFSTGFMSFIMLIKNFKTRCEYCSTFVLSYFFIWTFSFYFLNYFILFLNCQLLSLLGWCGHVALLQSCVVQRGILSFITSSQTDWFSTIIV